MRPTQLLSLRFPGSLILAACVVLGAGCASKNVDPATAQPHRGYIDFYAANDDELCWDIRDLGHNREIVRQFNPFTEHILRIALKPGEYKFRITFLNRVIPEPATVEVTVRAGMVTPVCVTFVETGTALVENKEVRVGGTYYGRYGRSTKFRDNEAGVFRLNAESTNSVSYQPKAGMTYARLPSQ